MDFMTRDASDQDTADQIIQSFRVLAGNKVSCYPSNHSATDHAWPWPFDSLFQLVSAIHHSWYSTKRTSSWPGPILHSENAAVQGHRRSARRPGLHFIFDFIVRRERLVNAGRPWPSPTSPSTLPNKTHRPWRIPQPEPFSIYFLSTMSSFEIALNNLTIFNLYFNWEKQSPRTTKILSNLTKKIFFFRAKLILTRNFLLFSLFCVLTWRQQKWQKMCTFFFRRQECTLKPYLRRLKDERTKDQLSKCISRLTSSCDGFIFIYFSHSTQPSPTRSRLAGYRWSLLAAR